MMTKVVHIFPWDAAHKKRVQRKTSVLCRGEMFRHLEEHVRKVEIVDGEGHVVTCYFQRPGGDVVSRDCEHFRRRSG